MKRILNIFLSFALCLTLHAQQQENTMQKVRFMPNGQAQAQFAGYYVAKDLGFFEQEGLDVKITHQGKNSTKGALSYLYDGEVDIVTMQLIPSLLQKVFGHDLVNILQTSQQSSLMYISHSALPDIKVLDGKKVTLRVNNYNQIASMMCEENGVYIDWVPSFQPQNLFMSKAVDAILAYSYNDGISILFSTGVLPKENIVYLSEAGFNCPEDGAYTTGAFLKKNPGAGHKFASACINGWKYAAEHQEEALDIVMKYVSAEKTMTNRAMQKKVLEEILRLQINPFTGKRDFSKPSEKFLDAFMVMVRKYGNENCVLNYEEFIQ